MGLGHPKSHPGISSLFWAPFCLPPVAETGFWGLPSPTGDCHTGTLSHSICPRHSIRKAGTSITCAIGFLPTPAFHSLPLQCSRAPQIHGEAAGGRASSPDPLPTPHPQAPSAPASPAPPTPFSSLRRSGRREGAGLRARTRPGLRPLSECRVGKLASAPQIPPGELERPPGSSGHSAGASGTCLKGSKSISSALPPALSSAAPSARPLPPRGGSWAGARGSPGSGGGSSGHSPAARPGPRAASLCAQPPGAPAPRAPANFPRPPPARVYTGPRLCGAPPAPPGRCGVPRSESASPPSHSRELR